jgi:hypothetical protein
MVAAGQPETHGTLRGMGDIGDRLPELVDRRRELSGSIAVMETHAEAEGINRHLCELENLTMRLAACWDGELDQIGAFSQIAYLHEKAERAEVAAGDIRKAIECISAGISRPQRSSQDSARVLEGADGRPRPQ